MGVIIRFRNLKDMPCILKIPEMVCCSFLFPPALVVIILCFRRRPGPMSHHRGAVTHGRACGRLRLQGGRGGGVERTLGRHCRLHEPRGHDGLWLHAHRAGSDLRLPLRREIHGSSEEKIKNEFSIHLCNIVNKLTYCI